MSDEQNVTPETQTDLNTESTTSATTEAVTVAEWNSGLSDEIKNDPSFSKIKDLDGLAKSYLSAQRMLGSRIPIPGKDASDEVKAEFYNKLSQIPELARIPSDLNDEKSQEALNDIYNKLGRPDVADKYDMGIPEDLPIDGDFIKSIKDAAHKAGLSQKQLKALSDVNIAHAKAINDAVKQQAENTRKFLQQTWGNTFDENKANYQGIMAKYAEKFPEAVAELKGSFAGNNPVVIMMAAELGRITKEGGTVLPGGSRSLGRTPEQAKQIISEVMSNKKHAYHNHADPAHEQEVARMRDLFKDAYPTNTDKSL